jgi:glycosyltransferase involved in cell wall biosynthesis
LPPRRGGGLNLYWRNSVIGFGQRGLDDALTALTLLPADVRLFLQGRLAADGGRAVTERIAGLGLRDRVTILAPYEPSEAVTQAAAYDIGLCLERRGPRNHDLTVSNKMFDYHMAGLAVVTTDLPGLAAVIRRSGAGVVCEPGVPASLAGAVAEMRSSPARLAHFQSSARRFAMEEANLEFEIEKIAVALRACLPSVSRVGSS